MIQLVQEINSTKTVIRTLNPDNIYVCKKDGVGKLYIASLKEAKDLLGNSTETRMEYIQETYGGDAFIAPEVKVGKKQFEKSDVYSVGKIMEYMLKDSDAFPMVNTLITRMIEIDVNKRIDLSKVKSEMEKIISPTLIVFDKTGIIDKREIQTRCVVDCHDGLMKAPVDWKQEDMITCNESDLEYDEREETIKFISEGYASYLERLTT